MADQKPLPALPLPATLAVDAQRHRSQLVRHFLSETQDAGIEHRLEGWAVVLEDVLDEMGQNIVADEWLSGFKRSRELQRDERRRRQAAAHEQRLKMAAKAKGGAGTEKPRDGSYESQRIPGPIVKELPEPPPPSKTRGRQLLLCVAPPRTRLPLPGEDGGSDIVPANIGCSFTAGTYTLQETDFPAILFGNKELAGAFSHEWKSLFLKLFCFRGSRVFSCYWRNFHVQRPEFTLTTPIFVQRSPDFHICALIPPLGTTPFTRLTHPPFLSTATPSLSITFRADQPPHRTYQVLSGEATVFHTLRDIFVLLKRRHSTL